MLYRNIYVATKAIGLSKSFHDAFCIKYIFNVIKPCTNHESFHDMTSHMKAWWSDNLVHVALQLINTNDNVVLCCNSGRSRSPMYLAAYLVIMYGYGASNAVSVVREMLQEQRSEVMDKNDALTPSIENLYCATSIYLSDGKHV